MPRARWWVVGVLGVVTVTFVTLDHTGVILNEAAKTVPPVPLVFQTPVSVAPALTPITDDASAIPNRVEQKLQHALDDEGLGGDIHAVVLGAGSSPLFAQSLSEAATPASTLKLLTALAVLDSIPPQTRIETTVVAGAHANQLVLVGGGDATLTVDQGGKPTPSSPASLEGLARQTARQLAESGVDRVHLTFDDTLFTGPAISPAWEPDYVTTGVVAPVTALMADQALVTEDELARYLDPSKAAASDFADLLSDEGVRVKGDPRSAAATSSATPIAVVKSPPVDLLVERMLRDSDNQLAEALGRLAALAQDEPASFTGATSTIVEVAKQRRIGVAGIEISDASGLSRDNVVTVDALGRVLQLATADDALRPILTGLPVAGFEGTLVDRYVQSPQNAAAGVARAKTGTLTGVSAEAGSTVSCAGDLLFFAFIADSVVDTREARDALDRAVATLSTCP